VKLSIFIFTLVLIAASYIPYFIGIFRGRIVPHPAQWLSWMIIISVYSLVLMHNDGGWATWVNITLASINAAVLVLGLKFARKVTFTTSDWICLVTSIIALGFWLLINQPALAVLLMTIASFIGFIPALRKAYRSPYDESAFTWSVNGFRYILTGIIVASYTFTTIVNPAFWALVYSGAAVFLLVRRKQLKDVNKEKTRNPF